MSQAAARGVSGPGRTCRRAVISAGRRESGGACMASSVIPATSAQSCATPRTPASAKRPARGRMPACRGQRVGGGKEETWGGGLSKRNQEPTYLSRAKPVKRKIPRPRNLQVLLQGQGRAQRLSLFVGSPPTQLQGSEKEKKMEAHESAGYFSSQSTRTAEMSKRVPFDGRRSPPPPKILDARRLKSRKPRLDSSSFSPSVTAVTARPPTLFNHVKRSCAHRTNIDLNQCKTG